MARQMSAHVEEAAIVPRAGEKGPFFSAAMPSSM